MKTNAVGENGFSQISFFERATSFIYNPARFVITAIFIFLGTISSSQAEVEQVAPTSPSEIILAQATVESVDPIPGSCFTSSQNVMCLPSVQLAADSACGTVGGGSAINITRINPNTWKVGCQLRPHVFFIVGLVSCPQPISGDPYSYNGSTGKCERPADDCPITTPLTPLDPAVQRYEDGHLDLDNLTQATRDGAACIMRSPRAIQIESGYRPPAYQTHLREVYDKWQLLKNNNDAACADIKLKVEEEYIKHQIVHQPGVTSRHSTGRAVDISLSSYATADAIAAGCGMSRPVPNDRVHFEPLR